MSLLDQKKALAGQCDSAHNLTDTLVDQAKSLVAGQGVDGAIEHIKREIGHCKEQIDAITLQLPRTISLAINASRDAVQKREEIAQAIKERLTTKGLDDDAATALAGELAISVRRVLKARRVIADGHLWREQATAVQDKTGNAPDTDTDLDVLFGDAPQSNTYLQTLANAASSANLSASEPASDRRWDEKVPSPEKQKK